MTADPCIVDEGLSLADAMDRMMANDIRHLVVVRNDLMVGIVDAGDLSLANAITGENLTDVLVSQAMRGLFRCPADTPLSDVVRTMEAHHFGCVAAVDDGNLVGIFTRSDALRALREIMLGHRIEAYTHSDVPNASADDSDGDRPVTPPRSQVRRLVDKGGASPSAGAGLVFGTVGV